MQRKEGRLALGGAAIAILLFSMPPVAHAAQSGTLTLSGVVAANNSITITPNGTANTNLNITGGNTNTNVASVQEVSNDPAGYKITVQSTTGGYLELNGTSATDRTAYQISYAGASMVTPTTTATTVKSVTSLSQQTTATSQLNVNVTADPNAVAGNYSDTLTFAIVAN